MTQTVIGLEDQALPAGWKWVKLGDFTDKIGSGATPRGGHAIYQVSGIPLIRSQNVLMNGFTSLNMAFISQEIHQSMSNTFVQPRDVLLNITGASIGRVCVVPNAICPANVNQHVCIIRLKQEILPGLLSYYISTDLFQRFIMVNQAGGTRQALTKSQIEDFVIPLPQLEEQERIVALLNGQMAAVEGAKKAAEERLEAAKALPTAYLREVFPSEEGELPDGWAWVKLKDVSSLITKGTTPTSFGAEYVSSGIPFIRATDVNGGAINASSAQFYIDEPTHQYLKRSQIVPGDLLITIAGTLGRTAYCPEDAPAMNCNQAVAITRLNRTAVDTEFVCWACQSPELIKPLLSQKAGGALQNLNLQQIGGFTLPIPPLSEQKRIAAVLDEQMAEVKLVQESIQQELETIDVMTAALLRKAFSGEL